MISADDVARLLTGMQPWLSQFPPEHHPTFFEVVTVLALRYFAEQQCDLVIWETGLGGRLDATNIVTPAACIITTIEHDHQQWLGETLEQIAMEKAGIIKPGAPVVTGAAPGRGLEVIQAAARDAGAPLTVVNEPDAVLAQFGRVLEIPLAGEHQRLNAALALSAVRVLLGRFPVDDSAARQGLATVRWPGRLQLVAQPGGRKLMLDGAHNPAGAAALRRAWEQQFPGVRPALILGLLRDKDWAGMAEILAPLAGRVLTVPVESARTLDPAVLAAACREVCPTALVEVSGSLADALGKVAHEPFVLIAGSLYLIGEALEELGLTPAPSADERGLNEWGALGGSRRPC